LKNITTNKTIAMNKNAKSLLDDHLHVLDEMQTVGTNEFFYTRLRVRLEARKAGEEWGFKLRPSLAIAALSLLLVLNGFLLFQYTKTNNKQDSAYSIQRFATDYNQSIESIY
jgi:hypothetical protein